MCAQVTYNLGPHKRVDARLAVGVVSNVRAHPHLSLRNMLLAVLLRLVQVRACTCVCLYVTCVCKC